MSKSDAKPEHSTPAPRFLIAIVEKILSIPSNQKLQTETHNSEYESAKSIAQSVSGGQEICLSEEEEQALKNLLKSIFNCGLEDSISKSCNGDLNARGLKAMNEYLSLRTFIVRHNLTLADLVVYLRIRCSKQVDTSGHLPSAWTGTYPHICRWYSTLNSKSDIRGPLERLLKFNTATKPAPNKTKTTDAAPSGAVYEGVLEGAVTGQVVTRFPPEPSGYLHIGHAKAALLNSYFAKKYQGRLIFRFDDTNPAKENDEFEETIMQDVKKLGVEWQTFSRTSDHFDHLMQLATKAIKDGIFYVDDTPTELMREQRGEGIESKCRNLPVEESLRKWNEMIKGSTEGELCCVRAKIDMQHKNKCMRDPVMYRCVKTPPHHVHGTKYSAYPTYDFACPVVDSIEGVTHALRTNEYSDRIMQYHWVQSTLGLRYVHIYEFSRLAFVKTLLSKRKLKYFVDNHHVTGWDDPRMPTVKGILRRGLRVDALLEFILQQGPSKSGNLMEWDKLWTINKQIIDPIVPRYMAVGEGAVPVIIKGAPEGVEYKERALHQKNASIGTAKLALSNKILIEQDDATQCTEGEEVTLMHWGNCIFDKIVKSATGQVEKIEATLHLEGDFKKTKKKLHWVADLSNDNATSCILREYDHLITVDKIEKDSDEGWENVINKQTLFDTLAHGDRAMKTLKVDDSVQLERRGYFRVDEIKADGTLVLIKIPDGKAKAVSAVSSKVDAAKLSGAKSRPNN